MSAARTVAAHGDDTNFALSQHRAWASLPAWLVPTAERPELVAVNGRGDWLPRLRAAAEQQGVRGLLLSRPSAQADPVDLRALMDSFAQGRIAVTVERIWSGHPGLEQLTARAKAADPVSLVDSLAEVASADPRTGADLLLDQVGLVRSIHAPIDRLRWADIDDTGHRVAARAGETLVALAGVRSATASGVARLAAYRASGEIHVRVPGGDTAEPVEIAVVGAAGELRLPTWYESPLRAAWRRLAEAVGRHELPQELADLAGDLDVVAAARRL